MGVNGSKTKRTQIGSPAPIKKAGWPMGVNGSTNKQNKEHTNKKQNCIFASQIPPASLCFVSQSVFQCKKSKSGLYA